MAKASKSDAPPLYVIGSPDKLTPRDELPEAVRQAVEGSKVEYVTLTQVQKRDLKGPFLVLGQANLGLYEASSTEHEESSGV